MFVSSHLATSVQGAGKMNQSPSSFREEIKSKFYVFSAGLVSGAILGWLFHGFIGTLVTILTILLILVPVAAALYFWYSVSRERDKTKMPSDVTDATWREVDDLPR
jgi:F0F1-type ATP synthase assembly protein I